MRSKGSGDTQADFTLSKSTTKGDDDEESIIMEHRIKLLLR